MVGHGLQLSRHAKAKTRTHLDRQRAATTAEAADLAGGCGAQLPREAAGDLIARRPVAVRARAGRDPGREADAASNRPASGEAGKLRLRNHFVGPGLCARQIPKWRQSGYRVELFFLSLPSADVAVQRVAERVRRGGHDISTSYYTAAV